MRRTLAFLWCTSLAAADVGQLEQLTAQNRLFDLRRAMRQPGSNTAETLFYRAVVTSRFGQEAAGIELLQEVLTTHPSPAMARKAHEEIASAFERTERYREAAQAWAEALLLTPPGDSERAGSENTQALMASLGDVAPQTVEFGADLPVRATHNRLGSWNVPVQVGGVSGEWIFDTGAELSTVTESEAKRMGLSVFETKACVTGSTDKKNALRLAVAGHLDFGAAHIHNVVFLVLADESLHIGPLRYQITGILGLPVLRALGRIEIPKNGMVQIHGRGTVPAGMPNLFFDEAAPIVEIGHDQHRLQMFLDTGANSTALYPSFRNALTPQETSRLKEKDEKIAGAGGMIKRKAALVPTLGIEIFETPVNLRKVGLLPEMPSGNKRYRDGVIGMDALWRGFQLDFDAMSLEVQ